MAFMPFVTAGDPDLSVTCDLIRTLAEAGTDLIEVGFPYSDPIADGPVIQASYVRALGRGLHVADILAAVGGLPTAELPPLVAMVSYAIVFRLGPARFLDEAAAAGFAGLIVPDLPGDEAEELAGAARARKLDLIALISPTTTPERADRILRGASGFVYCISTAGTTGVRDALPSELAEQLCWLRTRTDLPLAVGFGISGPDQVRTLEGLADGVIVGSALVRRIEPLATDPSSRTVVLGEAATFAGEMAAAVRE